MRLQHTVCAAIFLSLTLPASPHDVPAEIPQHFEAAAGNQDFSRVRTVALHVTSRSQKNPDTPEDLEQLRRRVLKNRYAFPFTLVPEKASADLSMELVVEPNLRYGMFHHQNAPYVYLTLREAASGRLVYCAYQRAGHLLSASDGLLHDLSEHVRRIGAPPSGSLAACAEQAMRPL